MAQDEAPKKNPPKKAAPKKAAPKKAAPKTKTKATSKRGRGAPKKPNLRDQLSQTIGLVGGGLTMAGKITGREKLTYDGLVVVLNGEKLADELTALAAQNVMVHRALETVCMIASGGGLAGAALAIAVPIAQNHEALPPSPLLPALVGARMPTAEDIAGGKVASAEDVEGSPVEGIVQLATRQKAKDDELDAKDDELDAEKEAAEKAAE